MDELIIEEMGKLTFGNEQLTAIELASYGNETFVIIGTKSSKLIMMEAKSQSAKVMQVSQLPIVQIFVDHTGAQDNFIVSDGFSFYQFDYHGATVNQLQVAPNTIAVNYAYRDKQLNMVQISSRGIELIQKQRSKISAFSTKKNQQDEQQVKFMLPDDVVVREVYIVDQDIIALLDASGQLIFYSLEFRKILELQQIDPQTECVQSTSRGLQRPCDCCKPNVSSGSGYICVTWHNLTFVVSTRLDDAQTHEQTAGQNEIVSALQQQRKKLEIPVDKLLLVKIQEHAQKPCSCYIHGSRLYTLFSNSIQVSDFADNCLEKYEILHKCQKMQTGVFGKIPTYLPKSTFKPDTFQLLVLTQNLLLVCFYPSVEEQIIQLYNQILCFLQSDLQEDDFSVADALTELLQKVKQLNEITSDTIAVKLLQQLIGPLITRHYVTEAVNVSNQILDYSGSDRKRSLQKLLPQFAACGCLHELYPLIPQPGSPQALSKQVYSQLIETLLLNDYELLSKVLKEWRGMYDPAELTIRVRQVLQIAKRNFQNQKLDPQYLRATLLWLYEEQGDHKSCCGLLQEMGDGAKLCAYCIENKQFEYLLDNLPRLGLDKHQLESICISLIDNLPFTWESICKVCSQAGISDLSQGIQQFNPLACELGIECCFRDGWDCQTASVLLDCRDSLLEYAQSRDKGVVQVARLAQKVLKMACSSKGKTQFQDLKLLIDYVQQLEQFVKSDMRIGFENMAIQQESGQQTQRVTLFCENFVRRYLKGLSEDARSAQIAEALLLGYQYEPTDTSSLMRYLQRLVSLVPEASADVLNFLAAHVQLPQGIVASTLRPLLQQCYAGATMLIQKLRPDLKQQLPLDELLQTGVGLRMLQELQDELEFQRAVLQVLAESQFEDAQRRHKTLEQGTVLFKFDQQQCPICGELLHKRPFIVFSCGCSYHEECINDLMNKLQIDGPVCPKCLRKDSLESARADYQKWIQVIDQ